MSESAPEPRAVDAATEMSAAGAKMFTELKASAHLLTFEAGLYCIVQTPSVRRPDDGTGLPGVRISLPPQPGQPKDAMVISSFRPDGWMSGNADAVLVRVLRGPAQALVTIYQLPTGAESAPRIQVLRLSDDPGAQPQGQPQAAAAAEIAPVNAEVVAHVQVRGDVGARLGDWVGDRGSKRWIEGFMVTPQPPIQAADLEYQAVLGRGWLSPWVDGGNLCGSRGMALPILGLRVRLKGDAAQAYDVGYSATFVDGSAVGPVAAGEGCEAESLAPMEAFQIVFSPRGAGAAAPAADADRPRTGRGIRGKPAAKKGS